MGIRSLNGERVGGTASGGSSISLHDTTHDPLGLWQLNGDLTDSSGNGYTLTVGSGTEQYAPLSDTLSGAHLDGSTYLIHDVAVSALRLTGDMTIECLVKWLVDPPGYGVNNDTTSSALVAHGVGGETEATNTLYCFGARSSGGGFTWVSESGGGTNAAYNLDVEVPTSVWHHMAAVRDSNVVSIYLDGALLGSSSSLTTPTGGSSGRFVIGALASGSSENPTCVIASVKLIGSALTAAQVKAEYQRTLG
jgi:hypothetical protein